ncbi:hypothetical protein PAESOLCIP111_01679 [Paenibacillus solanacearum]|uniref:Uncharacterized protein n=1 Tax=Paenibacillus solanacearum TaxID=2048548 RepID=A0A916K1H2_9BACL|nr:hypothetical protein PAESOLCIP111_01679 [Paenibacillus solanacearum]
MDIETSGLSELDVFIIIRVFLEANLEKAVTSSNTVFTLRSLNSLGCPGFFSDVILDNPVSLSPCGPGAVAS